MTALKNLFRCVDFQPPDAGISGKAKRIQVVAREVDNHRGAPVEGTASAASSSWSPTAPVAQGDDVPDAEYRLTDVRTDLCLWGDLIHQAWSRRNPGICPGPVRSQAHETLIQSPGSRDGIK